MLFARLALLATLMVARPAHACEQEAAELRAHLEHEVPRANLWNWAWRITFSVAAVGSLSVAIANPLPELRDGLFVSAGKATIAAAARWIMPLDIEVPPATADPCADVAALRAEVTRIAKKERRFFWLGHIAGVVLNAAGAIIIAERGSVDQGLLSVAVGYPVGLLSNYTMPRATWGLWRERSPEWNIAVVPRSDGWLLTVGLTL